MGTQPIACADCRARGEETSGGMILCSYHFGHECKPWCGLPYGDDRVPTRAAGPVYLANMDGVGMNVSSYQEQRAYCTAACLERAKANQPPPAPVKREPVAPWVRLDEAGVAPWCEVDGYIWCCTTSAHGNFNEEDDRLHRPFAVYGCDDGGLPDDADDGACEACAERAGVFGPVSGAVPNPPVPLYPTRPPSWPTDGGTRPTCSGPLSTHGTPVLRVVGKPRWWDADDGKSNRKMLCDACYLAAERDVAESTSLGEWIVPADRPPVAEPPARIGTVPMSIGPGAGIGIWARRGMRR